MTRPQELSGDQGRESGTSVSDEEQRDLSKRCYGIGWRPAPGAVLLSRRGKDILLAPRGDGAGDNAIPPLSKYGEGLSRRGSASATPHYGPGSSNTNHDATAISQRCSIRTNSEEPEPRRHEGTPRENEAPSRRTTTNSNDDGVCGLQMPVTTEYSRSLSTVETATQTDHCNTDEQQVQTDTCDKIYVSEQTLVAYTIAIVQNTQTFQFDQMRKALQCVQNEAAIETPSRAEKHTRDHFDIKLFTDNCDKLTAVNAEKHKEQTAVDTAQFPSTEETTPKTIGDFRPFGDTKPQVTGTVQPTQRKPEEPKSDGPVDGIPAGYETDDSWGHFNPDNALSEPTPDLEEEIFPLLMVRAWAASCDPPNHHPYKR